MDLANKAKSEAFCVKRLPTTLDRMSVGDPNLPPWERRSVAARVGFYCHGRRVIGNLSISGLPTIATLWPVVRRFWPSTCMNTRITSTLAPSQRPTLMRSWRRSTGTTVIGYSAKLRKPRRLGMRLPICFLIAIAIFVSAPVGAQEIDWQKVDSTLGRKPAVSGDVHRYGFPRSDLSVTLDGVTIKPALALGGWVAFKPVHGGAMIMGDIVLLETEINPVMAKLIEGGLQITAVHNHLLRANPPTFYMHVGGHGDPAKMAGVIHEALSVSKTPLTISAATSPP